MPMDKIVSTVCFEGVVYIFTEFGVVYRMYKDFSSSGIGEVVFHRVAKLELR